ncbi:MAG: hypothetical protein M4579_000244 [Chaenotheca gracillima]|nr:MAG: hypothetical protein M4579_000244 [Chaenotheca gracillima]
MAWSFWAEDRYRDHFFCALCGGPFARVYRTDGLSHNHVTPSPNKSLGEEEIHSSHTIPSQGNRPLTDDELYANAYPNANLEQGLQDDNGRTPHGDSTKPAVKLAYDGSSISDREMRWTGLIRALIHRDAQVQPEGGLDQMDALNHVYLTGRGRVKECGSLADAYASMEAGLEDDDMDENDIPTFYGDDCRFHMYEEPGREDCRYLISSIPFHENCCDIFFQAIESCRTKRSLPKVLPRDAVDLDLVWSYLCELLPPTSSGKRRGTVISRLTTGCMGNQGYREAQACNDGRRWLHSEGLEWLVANPQIAERSFNLQRTDVRSGSSSSDREDLPDPFRKLGFDITCEIFKYLSCVDAFRWRAASVYVNAIELPPRLYLRYLKEENEFLPGLLQKVEEIEASDQVLRFDWKSDFQTLSREWRSDKGLRNLRRIWKIVEPMADELVERSRQNIKRISQVDEHMAGSITVVRGDVGIRSGRQGDRTTLIFAKYLTEDDPISRIAEESMGHLAPRKDHLAPSEFVQSLQSTHVWLDPERKNIRGLEFVFVFGPEKDDPKATQRLLLGSRTTHRESIGLEAEAVVLTGFNVCWYNGCVQGIQFIYEEPNNRPTEFRDAEFVSHMFGAWNGPSRRLVAPRKYRNLAGISCFVNSQGDIETFSILEEKVISTSSDGQYMLIPPDTIPCVHGVSSLWDHPPPADVDLIERVGPTVADWKIRPAACEIFVATAQHNPPSQGYLETITGFANDDFLVGLNFQYRNENGEVIVRELGHCVGSDRGSLHFEPDDEVSAAIIGHSDLGIHSIQMISSSGRIGPAIGSRYRGGAPTVFIKDEIFPGRIKESLGIFTFLSGSIIGFHCLYSSELHRFLQLGVVTTPEPPRSRQASARISSIQPSPQLNPSSFSNMSLPFLEEDELRNSWVDGAPPRTLTKGKKNSDSTKTLSVPSRAGFTGWVSLEEPFSQIIIYGQMEGLRFCYASKDRAHSSFGNTASYLAQQIITPPRGDRITTIASSSTPQSMLNTVQSSRYLNNIYLLGSKQFKARSDLVEVESDFLAGIQFVFSATSIVDWHPLYDFNRSFASGADLQSRENEMRDHWKSSLDARIHPFAETDADTLGKFRVVADFFDGPREGESADGVKGYINNARFCGLRFRRGGEWDEAPLGRASAFESDFLLEPGETFASLFVAKTESLGGVGAVALSTSFGRVSRWFGAFSHGRMEAKVPPTGRKAVGIFMAYSRPDECESVDIIHDEAKDEQFPMPTRTHLLLDPTEMSRRESMADRHEFPFNYRLSPEFGAQEGRSQRASTVFEPEHLEKIEAFVNSTPGRFGLKGLKIIGNRRMGTVILNDWQDAYVSAVEHLTLMIDGKLGREIEWRKAFNLVSTGANGERITAADIRYHLTKKGRRIIGLTIKTNRRQQKDLAKWSLFTDEKPPTSEIGQKEIQCESNETVVGFHYTFEV